jgi:hypothetical protein
MNFQAVATRFENADSGTDSFKVLYRDAFELMKTDPDNAALYFVVGTVARAYVRRYEDQGVSLESADRATATLVGYNNKVLQALATDAGQRLRLLGEIALDYEWSVSDF